MPVAKSKRRQAIAPKRPDADASLDVDLAEIDIKVDEMKAALEKGAEGTISEMRRIVETAILRLPSKIKGMRMREFMTDYGGDAALVLEKDRKQSRVARTVAKPLPGSRLDTIMRNKSALSRVAVGVGPVDVGGALSAAGSAGIGGAPAAKQPRLHYAAGSGPAEDAGIGLPGLPSSATVGASSGAAGTAVTSGVPAAGAASSSSAVGVSGAPVLRKPLLSAPTLGLGGAGAGSAALFAPTPGRGPSVAPSVPMFNPLLPKTPAARKPRKGEVVMGYSANGSPLGAISLPAVNAGPAMLLPGAAAVVAPLVAASSLASSATAGSAAVVPSAAAVAHLAVPAPGATLPAGMAPETVAATIAALEQQLAMLRAAAPAMAAQAVGADHAAAGGAAVGASHVASSATATAGAPSAHPGGSRSVAKPTGSMSRLAAVTGISSSGVLSSSAVKPRPAAGERR